MTNQDYFLHLIATRFTELKIAELATDLITPNVLHEMAVRCPSLQVLTLGKLFILELFPKTVSGKSLVVAWAPFASTQVCVVTNLSLFIFAVTMPVLHSLF